MLDKTLEFDGESGADSILRIAIPVEQPAHKYHVVVHLLPDTGVAKQPKGWPAGFFERTAGQWVGDLERAPQGDYETRDSF